MDNLLTEIKDARQAELEAREAYWACQERRGAAFRAMEQAKHELHIAEEEYIAARDEFARREDVRKNLEVTYRLLQD